MINFIRKMENLASKYKKYKDIAWERPSFLAYHVGKEIQDFNRPQTPFKPEMLPLFKRGVGWDLSLGSIRRLVVLVNWQVVLLLFKSITGRIGTYSKTDIAKLKHHYPLPLQSFMSFTSCMCTHLFTFASQQPSGGLPHFSPFVSSYGFKSKIHSCLCVLRQARSGTRWGTQLITKKHILTAGHNTASR